MSLELKLAYDSPRLVCELFNEYTAMLVELDPIFETYLGIQNYEAELQDLEKKYGFPGGRLYLAFWEGEMAGCIALHRLDDERCEMKRLYVRPAFRGKHISDVLIAHIMEDARSIGYKHMLLDTLPCLEAAVYIYRKLGFYEIPCYNDSPMEKTYFMQYDL